MDSFILVESGLGIAATAAIVQSCKKAGLKAKYAPLLSLAVGMSLSVVYGVVSMADPVSIIVMGFLFGGVASHGYDVVKKAKE